MNIETTLVQRSSRSWFGWHYRSISKFGSNPVIAHTLGKLRETFSEITIRINAPAFNKGRELEQVVRKPSKFLVFLCDDASLSDGIVAQVEYKKMVVC